MTKMLGSLDEAFSSWENEILPDLQHKARSIQSLNNELATTQNEGSREYLSLLIERAKRASQAISDIPRLFYNNPDNAYIWKDAISCSDYSASDLLAVIVMGYLGPDNPQGKLTAKDRQKWKSDVSQTSQNLAALLSGSDLQSVSDERVFNLYKDLAWLIDFHVTNREEAKALKGALENRVFESSFGFMWDLERLTQVNADSERFKSWHDLQYTYKPFWPEITLKKPNDTNAPRAYFIRYVTYCFLNLTNTAYIGRVKRLSDTFYSEVDEKSIRGLTADLTAAHKR
ncbi:hypothetical protein [Alteromonas stellipolaris]|uniref:hypothetical protein n=1 Tax=Alteromonas stellipolaris TaxID=233316 RepID=UPI0027355786|nr:hypothetical protein [Alteromonas stellipolaris]MDP2534929.1 hypothetical protein [Alteromonas stellipolaris]